MIDKGKIIIELREARDRITYGIKLVHYSDEVEDIEEFSKGMKLIEDGYSDVSKWHEELYIILARLVADKEAAEPDESYDEHPGARIGQ